MNSLVKNAFLTIMGAVLAFTLYVLFFGTQSFDGRQLGTSDGVTIIGEWNGLLWYAAGAIEEPIAQYYYKYCLVPTVHQNDGVDEALDIIVDHNYYGTRITQGGGIQESGIAQYSTGWK